VPKFGPQIAPRLGLNKAEFDTVEWLGALSFADSDMAQKRDISDPRTGAATCQRAVANRSSGLYSAVCAHRLRYPGAWRRTRWNNWKAVFDRGLYRQDQAGTFETDSKT